MWVLHIQIMPVSGDSFWYANVASNLVEGKGFVVNHHNVLQEPPDVPQVTAFFPPGYALALAAFWRVFGVSVTSAKIFNAVLGTLTIPFVYSLGCHLFHRRVGLVAAGVFALSPSAILWLPFVLSEPFFTLLFVVALWVLVAVRPGPRIPWPAIPLSFGLLVGFAVLTRGQALVLLPAALLFWFLRDGWRPGLQQTMLVVLAMIAVVIPWTIRNWAVMNSPILIAANAGLNLRIGHAPASNGTFLFFSDPIDGFESYTEWEVQINRVYTRRAIEYAVTHPGRELELAKNKMLYLYRSESRTELPALRMPGSTSPHPRERILGPLIDVAWYAVLLCAAGSTLFWLRKRPDRMLFAAVFVLWTLFHVVFFGLERYHLPLLPLLVIVATGGVWLLLDRTRAFLGRWRSGPREESPGAPQHEPGR